MRSVEDDEGEGRRRDSADHAEDETTDQEGSPELPTRRPTRRPITNQEEPHEN